MGGCPPRRWTSGGLPCPPRVVAPTRPARVSGADGARRARRETHAEVVLRRPDDPPRGGAHLLLAHVAVPGRAAGRLAARAHRPVPGDLRRDHRLPAGGRAAVGRRAARQLAAQRAAAQGHGRERRRHQRRGRALRDHRRAGGGAPRAQRRVRGRRRPELPAPQGHRHRVDGRAPGARPGDARARLRRRRLRAGPPRLPGPGPGRRPRLGRRALARRRARGHARLRLRLLRHARRAAALVPVGHPRRHRRASCCGSRRRWASRRTSTGSPTWGPRTAPSPAPSSWSPGCG